MDRPVSVRSDREHVEIAADGRLLLSASCDCGEVHVVAPPGGRPLTYREARAFALHLLDWARPEADELRELRRAVRTFGLHRLDWAPPEAGGTPESPL